MPEKSARVKTRRKAHKLSRGNQIVFNRKGLLLTTDTTNRAARRLIESSLCYDREVYLRGKEAKRAGRSVVIEEVACFDYAQDETGVYPEMLCCAAGWIPKLRSVLTHAGFGVKVINRTPHKNPDIFVPRWDRLKGITLRWRQDEVINTILKYDYARVDCPTGYGKSWMIAAICQLLPQARIHIATHSTDVTEQLYYDLSTKLPNIGLCMGRKKKREGSRVMLYSGKSLHHGGFDADILLVDEVHEFGTADYMARVQQYRTARLYGLSASHDARKDNADFELEGLFGKIRARISYQDAVDHDCVVPIKVFWKDVVSDINPVDGIDDPVARNRWGVWRNKFRNRAIARAANEFDADTQVLIVVDTIDHAVHLKQMLPDFQLCYSEAGMDAQAWAKYHKWGLLDSSEPTMTPERRFHLKTRFSRGSLKKVIATSVWNRGVDFRNLQVLIRGDSKASKIADTQVPGRVSRLSPDGSADPKAFGIVIDFLDQFDPSIRARSGKRKRNYVEMGWEQVMPSRATPQKRLPKKAAKKTRAVKEKRRRRDYTFTQPELFP